MTTTPRRSAKALPTKIEPVVQDTYEMHLSTLEYRFGKAVMIEGFLGAPNLVRRLATHEDIGMTRTEMNMWEHIISKQRDNQPPWLAVHTIAELMHCSERSVQRYLRRLEKKGLLIVQYNVLNIHNRKTNTYDFTPLYAKVVALYDKLQAEYRAVVENYMQSDNRGDRSIAQSGVTQPVEQPHMGDTSNVRDITARQNTTQQPDVAVAQNFAKQPDHSSYITANLPHNCRENAADQPPNEESYKEDLLNRYDSRSRTDKELIPDTHDYTTDGYTNPLETTEQPTNQRNDSYNDQDYETNVRNENENRNSRPTESAGGAGNSGVSVDNEECISKAAQFIVNFEDQQYLKIFMNDMSAEMHDEETSFAPNVSRLTNLYREFHHLFEDAYRFGLVVEEARMAAKKAKVTKKNSKGQINRVPYFFTVLEGLLVEMHTSYLLSIRE